MRKWVLILNVLFLLLVVGFLIYFVWRFSFNSEVVINEECVDVNRVASFVYDACYDNSSKNIFVEAKRGYDIYQLQKIRFSFFDYSSKTFDVVDVPNTNEGKSYKIFSEKNPGKIDIYLGVVKDFSSPICEEPRKIFVRECPFVANPNQVNASFNPLKNNTVFENFVNIGSPRQSESDILSPNLVDKSRVWSSICESTWECSPWEDCVGGIQKRSCEDVKNCSVSTKVPETARYCDGSCVENWACIWSECKGGFTVPSCRDLNSCGTEYNLPQRLECKSDRACIPEVECGEWSECDIDYNFLDLASGTITDLKGKKSRMCSDKNSCVAGVEEKRDCSVSVDVYTRTFTKCGTEYLGIYNRLNNELIARIDKDNYGRDSHLDVYLDEKTTSEYCDYCFDGLKDGDEEDVDCGGGCMKCAEKYARVDYKRNSAFSRFTDWFKRLVS